MSKLWWMRVWRPIVARFPAVFYRVALVAGWIAWHVRGELRRNVIHNLLPLCDGDLPRAKRDGLRVFQYVAQYYVDLTTLPRRNMALFERDHLRITNPEYLGSVEHDGPVVLVSAHTGNVELAIQALTHRGRGFVALVEALQPPEWGERLLELRSSAGGHFYEADFGGVRACLEALKQGQVLGMMGDRDIQGTGIRVAMFGRQVKLPRGPWEIARRTGALVVPVFCRRRLRDDFEVAFAEPYRVGVSDSLDADIRKAVERYAALLETHLRHDPGQWVVMEDFWRVHAATVGPE